VPPSELATSGISGLDAQLGGGFPRGSTILVLGEPCNALSVFAEQFCAGGLSQGETGLYFEFDRPIKGCGDRIRSLAQDLGGAKGQLRVFDGYGAQFGANGKGLGPGEQRVAPGNALGEVLNEAMKTAAGGRYRLAVESLSSLVAGRSDAEVLDFMRQLVHVGHETESMQMATLIRGLHSPQLEAGLKHAATGVLEIGVERKGFGLYNYLQVNKMLNLRDPTRILLFRETDKGLWLESTKRVF
jgi:KaiC/GvpD/RAD55 family RecA-like ATPase